MLPNKQPISKKDHTDGKFLYVHSLFHTIQGEGPFTGDPAVFIRLAGCNMRCPACDTEYTTGTNFLSVHTLVGLVLRAITKEVKVKQRYPLVVITGGEPFRQNIGPLTRLLLDYGYRIQVETNGTLYLEDFPYGHPRVTIVCSPKAGKVAKELLPHINAYKYVIETGKIDIDDGLPTSALGLPNAPARPPARYTGLVYVNPLDSKDSVENHNNLLLTARVAKTYGYRLGVQLHKILGYE